MGKRNAAVLPDPVLAMATTSLPSSTRGIHYSKNTVFHFISQNQKNTTGDKP